MAEVPVSTPVYLTKPTVSWTGRKQQQQVVSGALAQEVRELGETATGAWARIQVRPTERGYLADEFRAVRVWTLGKEEKAAQEEWLVARREEDGRVSYALSNAGVEASLGELAGRFFRRPHARGKVDYGLYGYESCL